MFLIWFKFKTTGLYQSKLGSGVTDSARHEYPDSVSRREHHTVSGAPGVSGLADERPGNTSFKRSRAVSCTVPERVGDFAGCSPTRNSEKDRTMITLTEDH